MPRSPLRRRLPSHPELAVDVPGIGRRALELAAVLGLHDPETAARLAGLSDEELRHGPQVLATVPERARPRVARWALGRARRLLLSNPELAGEALTLAREAAEWIPLESSLSGIYFDVLAEARALATQRALGLGNLPAARREAHHARCLSGGGSGDPLVLAEVLATEAGVAWAGGERDEAAESLAGACELLRQAEQLDRLAPLLLALAQIRGRQGETSAAREAREELATLPPEHRQGEETCWLLQVLATGDIA